MTEVKWTNKDTLKYNVTEFANMAEFLKYQNLESVRVTLDGAY